MERQRIAEVQDLPYAELIIKPGDSRPIVIRIDQMGGEVYVSDGSAEDVVEAHVVLALMGAVSRAVGHVRLIKEMLPPRTDGVPTSVDDIPF